ncbi:MAG: DUF2188 domain-containing protein [Bacteroidota bacterium]
MKKNVHVVPHDGKWAVKTDNAIRPARVTETQKQAIDRAKEIATNNGSEVVIHGRDGKIREKNSYGNDPYPPQG